jgi:hypothetical protein
MRHLLVSISRLHFLVLSDEQCWLVSPGVALTALPVFAQAQAAPEPTLGPVQVTGQRTFEVGGVYRHVYTGWRWETDDCDLIGSWTIQCGDWWYDSNLSDYDTDTIPGALDEPDEPYPGSCQELQLEFDNKLCADAQAANGCSVPGNLISGWGEVSFTNSCNNHDICYGADGASRISCDDHFLTDIQADCEQAFTIGYQDAYQAGAPEAVATQVGNESRHQCNGAGHVFAGAVAIAGLGNFNIAQTQLQCRKISLAANARNCKPLKPD